MAENNSNLVTRVWNYAHVLRRQGVPFGDYIEQITYLLFLKMDEEREELLGEASSIPDRYRWHCLRGLDVRIWRDATGRRCRSSAGRRA